MVSWFIQGFQAKAAEALKQAKSAEPYLAVVAKMQAVRNMHAIDGGLHSLADSIPDPIPLLRLMEVVYAAGDWQLLMYKQH